MYSFWSKYSLSSAGSKVSTSRWITHLISCLSGAIPYTRSLSWVNSTRYAWSAWRWRSYFSEKSVFAFVFPYTLSPITGCPIESICSRIWCVRPVRRSTSTSEARSPKYPSTLYLVWASFGLIGLCMVCFFRSFGSRHIYDSMYHFVSFTRPATIVIYVFLTVRLLIWRWICVMNPSFFAIIRIPEVSLSRRCTSHGRSIPLITESDQK